MLGTKRVGDHVSGTIHPSPTKSEIAVYPTGQYDILAGISPRDVLTIELIGVMIFVIVMGWLIDALIADYKKHKEGRRR
jgi:hypothetical protein